MIFAIRNAFLFTALSLLLLPGCATTRTDISDQPPYKSLVGTTWELKEGMYIIVYTDGSGEPGLLKTPKSIMPDDNAVLDASNIGKTLDHDSVVKGIIPAGTVLKIIKVIEEDSFEGYDPLDIIVQPQGELAEEWPELLAGQLEETYWADEETKQNLLIRLNPEFFVDTK